MSSPRTPYRSPASEPPQPPDDGALDDRPTLWFLVLVGALRTVFVLARNEAWEAGTVVLALVAWFAGRELFAMGRRARRDR